MTRAIALVLLLAPITVAGCADPQGGQADAVDVDGERPPVTGQEDIEAWLREGSYKSWKCEPVAHERRSGSGHSRNRICSNAALSAHGDGEFPVDSASVKELVEDDGTIDGYAVYRHVKAGKGGDTWYWYERIGTRLVADGLGTEGAPKSTCVSCHEGAGIGGKTGHDLVFTQVR